MVAGNIPGTKEEVKRMFPLRRCQPLPIEDAEQLRKAIVARLTEIEMSLRIKGDHYHAENVRRFKERWFVNAEEKESNFEVIDENGTVKFRQ